VLADYEAAQSWNILHNNVEPLVSLDFKKCDYSAVVDGRWTDVIRDRMVKLVLWYDNEWGYSSRVVDQVRYIHEQMNGAPASADAKTSVMV
jgi:glyceraldehyde 3-phosphate dehydrogenase